MIPAAGGSQTLPRNTRQSGAMDVLLTGRRFDAAEALTLGLVTRLVTPENLLEESMVAARRLAELHPDAVAAAKSALRLGQDLPLAEALDMETRLAGGVLR
jgi:enoyl-CoA hydratase/carnithine racemase